MANQRRSDRDRLWPRMRHRPAERIAPSRAKTECSKVHAPAAEFDEVEPAQPRPPAATDRRPAHHDRPNVTSTLSPSLSGTMRPNDHGSLTGRLGRRIAPTQRPGRRLNRGSTTARSGHPIRASGAGAGGVSDPQGQPDVDDVLQPAVAEDSRSVHRPFGECPQATTSRCASTHPDAATGRTRQPIAGSHDPKVRPPGAASYFEPKTRSKSAVSPALWNLMSFASAL